MKSESHDQDKQNEESFMDNGVDDNTGIQSLNKDNEITSTSSSSINDFSRINDGLKSHIKKFSPASISNSLSNGRNSERKRSRRAHEENPIDDILVQITSKMNSLSTSENSRQVDLINAFMEVLGCDSNEASFYLESTQWNIESAVTLWLENNTLPNAEIYNNSGTNNNHRTYNNNINNTNNDINNINNNNKFNYNRTVDSTLFNPKDLWYNRLVQIEGLPIDWEARVNPQHGTVYFIHIPSGNTQEFVPPGYADRYVNDNNTSNGWDVDNNENINNYNNKNKDKNYNNLAGFNQNNSVWNNGSYKNVMISANSADRNDDHSNNHNSYDNNYGNNHISTLENRMDQSNDDVINDENNHKYNHNISYHNNGNYNNQDDNNNNENYNNNNDNKYVKSDEIQYGIPSNQSLTSMSEIASYWNGNDKDDNYSTVAITDNMRQSASGGDNNSNTSVASDSHSYKPSYEYLDEN
eukprot:gene5139-7156_t